MTVNEVAFSDLSVAFLWPLIVFPNNFRKRMLSFIKKTKIFKSPKKKRYPENPGFEPGNSDPIANHITTRPRSIYKNWAKNFADFLISYMIY